MRRVLAILSAIACVFTSAMADGFSTSTEEGVIAAIATRLDKNEKQIERWEKINKLVKINGFVQGLYEWSDDRTGDGTTGKSSFGVHRARLIIASELYKSKKGRVLDFWSYLDFMFLPKSPVLDLRFGYKHSRELNLIVGHMQNPIHFEEQFRPSKFEFIDFSYAACHLAKLGGNEVTTQDVPLRETGFRLYGGFFHRENFSILNYNIGFFNNVGAFTRNTNRSGDFFCRLFVKPTEALDIAVHYQWGEGNFSSVKLNNPDIYAGYRWDGNPEYLAMHRMGAGFSYITNSIFARGEYICGLTGKLASESCYLEGGYKLHLPRQLGFTWAGTMIDYYCRDTFDLIKRDTRNANIDMRYTLSFGWELSAYYRIQLAYSLEQRLHYTFANNRAFGNGVKVLVTASF